MQFELKNYNRDISDNELIDDLKKVALLLGKQSLTSKEYDCCNGKRYASGTISRRFKGWNKALEKAGLSISYYHVISNQELLNDLIRVQKEISPKKLTQRIYSLLGKFGTKTINTRFGWNNALKTLDIEVSNEYKIPEIELFKNLEQTWIKLGKQPGKRDMRTPNSKYTEGPYINRFGSWQRALQAFVEFVKEEERSANEIASNVQINHQSSKDSGNHKSSEVHKTKRDINLRLRFLVMRRDNFKCVICGRSPATDPKIILHVDHIKPWEKGGETIIENLQTLCSDDNLGKSNLDMYSND